MYSLHITWYGRHGIWQPIWSFSLMEYAPGDYAQYLILGNRIHLTDRLFVDLDYVNRAMKGQPYFATDFTLVGEMTYRPIDELHLILRASHDANTGSSTPDYCVYPGTKITQVAGGLEYYPLSDQRVRLHAYYGHSMGENTHPTPFNVNQLSLSVS